MISVKHCLENTRNGRSSKWETWEKHSKQMTNIISFLNYRISENALIKYSFKNMKVLDEGT